MMNKNIEISREMAERIIKDGAISVAQIDQLRQKLAATEAPCQEPVAWIDPASLKHSRNEKQWVRIAGSLAENRANGYTIPLYAAPLSPDHSGGGAGVVLPERKDFEEWRDRRNAMIADDGGSASWYVTQTHYATWEACLDKIKELNQ